MGTVELGPSCVLLEGGRKGGHACVGDGQRGPLLPVSLEPGASLLPVSRTTVLTRRPPSRLLWPCLSLRTEGKRSHPPASGSGMSPLLCRTWHLLGSAPHRTRRSLHPHRRGAGAEPPGLNTGQPPRPPEQGRLVPPASLGSSVLLAEQAAYLGRAGRWDLEPPPSLQSHDTPSWEEGTDARVALRSRAGRNPGCRPAQPDPAPAPLPPCAFGTGFCDT